MFGINFLFALMLANPQNRYVDPLCAQDCASYVMQVRTPSREQRTLKKGPLFGPIWSRGMLVGKVNGKPVYLTPGPTRLGSAYGLGFDGDW